MRRLLFRAGVAVLTFIVGATAAVFYVWQRTPVAEIPPISLVDVTPPICSLGKSVAVAGARRGISPYFPTGVFDPEYDREPFESKWYSKHLQALDEPSLLDARGFDESYRFLWLRTFHHPVAIRVWRVGNEHFISAKESDGAGGYEPGKVIANSERNLSAQEWDDFLRLLYDADYWCLGDNGMGGLDGAQWILEGFREGSYHIAVEWSPREGAYREACLYLLKLSGLNIDPSSSEVY
jgi:hypothetical protein